MLALAAGKTAALLEGGHAVSAGYQGPPELTVARAFSSWTLDPWALCVIVVLGAAYLAGVRTVRRRGGHWPAGRAVLFLGLGLGFGVIATMSFIGVYYPVLFYIRSVQTVLMLLVVPLFLALGRPLSLIGAVSPRAGQLLAAAIGSGVARVVTFPPITTFVLVLTPFAVYFTPWYASGLTSELVAQFTRVALLLPGFVFFWTLLRVDPVPKAYPYVVTLWITAAEVVGDAVLGIAVIASTTLIAGPYYHALARPWGPSLATSQVLGGGVLWILGDIVGVPFLAAQLIQMMREDEADAKVIDAELDAQEAATAATGAGLSMAAAQDASGVAAESGGIEVTSEVSSPAVQRPWWETDSRFADRFRSLDEPD
ncbi:MAG TPA: cytochrome c oxidase assembly protein [Streptosporangiaceae bacterium]|jgi:cytochrome c oxidase assembly factor CtaG